MIKRINLYGGPGSGKSTAAHFLMWRLKSAGLQAELSREWIKRLAFRGPAPERIFLQPVACGAQLDEELQALATGAVVVTDSPLLLQAAYAECELDLKRSVVTAQEMEKRHPAVHILLDRGGKPFAQEGRWEDEEAAKAKDQTMVDLLQLAGFRYHAVPHNHWERLWSVVAGELGRPELVDGHPGGCGCVMCLH